MNTRDVATDRMSDIDRALARALANALIAEVTRELRAFDDDGVTSMTGIKKGPDSADDAAGPGRLHNIVDDAQRESPA